MKASTPKARAAEIRDIITVHYLNTGKEATVKELADFSGRSESWIYKALNESNGVPDGCSCADHMRHHKIWTYFPSRSTLRQIIVDAQAQMSMPKAYNGEGDPIAW